MSNPDDNFIIRFMNGVVNALDAPATFIREKIILPNRPKEKTYWYHEKFRRVPDIDECYVNDFPCIYEAEEQFKRDMKVDQEIVRILRRRFEDCVFYEMPDHEERCAKVRADFDENEINFFIKYGDLGPSINVRDAYMKQKHRLVFERRKAEGKEFPFMNDKHEGFSLLSEPVDPTKGEL